MCAKHADLINFAKRNMSTEKVVVKSQNKESINNAKGNSVSLARFFLLEYPHLALDENRELYIYNKGIYEDVDEKHFDELYMSFLKKNNITDIWKLNRINEVKRAVYALKILPIVKFDSYNNLICLKNCIINLDEMKRYEFSHKYFFTTRVDINYEEDCPHPKDFANFLQTTFTLNNEKPDMDTINNIIKIGGYLLYPQNNLEKMFLFLGEGANGKSILMTIFEMFFDEKNISYLDLDTLSSSSSLEREKLIGSRINSTTEAKSNHIDSEMIKKIISSEGITITRKFRVPVDYKPLTKLIVASNTQPSFNDSTHGIYRRIFPITFRNRFISKEEHKETPMTKVKRIYVSKDKNKMLKKIHKERSAILNLFLSGLKKLIDNDWQLIMSKNSDETLEEYKNTSDTATYFLKEFYIEDSDKDCEGLTAENILLDYRSWYRANVSESPLKYGVQTLGRKIKELWRIDSHRKYTGQNKRERFYPLKRRNYAEEIIGDTSNNGDKQEEKFGDKKEVSQKEIDFKQKTEK